MEVVVADAGLPGSISVASQSWVQVHSLVNSGPRVAAQSRYALGAGEMSAILLAHQLRADLVLIDELLSLRNTVTNLCTEPRTLASGSRLLTRAVP